MKNYQVAENCKNYLVQKHKVENAVELTNNRIAEIHAEVSYLKEEYLKSMDDAMLVKINTLKAEEITLVETLPLKRQLANKNKGSRYQLTEQDQKDVKDINAEVTKNVMKDVNKLLGLFEEVDELLEKIEKQQDEIQKEVQQTASSLTSATGLNYHVHLSACNQGEINRKLVDLGSKRLY